MLIRTIVYLIITFILVFTNYFLRGFISGYFRGLYNITGKYEYVYIPQIIVGLINIIILFVILFDLYYGLFKSKLVSRFREWIIGLLTNYLLLVVIFAAIVYSYTFFLLNFVLVSGPGFEARLNGLNTIYIMMIFLIGLVYVSFASVRYLVMYFEKKMFPNIVKLISIVWANKGSFLIWLFMGYVITGSIGVTGEIIGSIMMVVPGFPIVASQVFTIVFNTAVIYVFYKYFVENYITDIIFHIRSKQLLKTN